MGTLNEKIKELELKIKEIESKVIDLSRNVQDKNPVPYSKVGNIRDRSQIRTIDTKTGLGQILGGNMIYNDSEIELPPYNQQPDEPTIGYNKHSHSRYAGGALDINTLELVEYRTHSTNKDSLGYPIILDSKGNPINKHTQNYWKETVEIVKENNVEKIGLLDISFDSSSKKWVAGSKEVDVVKTHLVQYIWKKAGQEVPEGTDGATKEIKTDDNGNEMKSPLLFTGGSESTVAGRNENLNKSNVYWDKDAQCWRFYSIFKPYPEEE